MSAQPENCGSELARDRNRAASRASSLPQEFPQSKPSRLWLWFVAAFLIQAAAWTTWFVIAAHHPVQEIPLAGAR